MIDNRVVRGGPQLKVPDHLSFSKYVIDKWRSYSSEEEKFALINGITFEEVTYRQLLDKTMSIARGLKKLGLRPGEVVAICSQNCTDYIMIAVAVLCAGATLTTLNLKYTRDEILHVLNLSKPRVVFCSKSAIESKLDIIKEASCVEFVVGMDCISDNGLSLKTLMVDDDVGTFEPEHVNGENDVAFILYSSGTTGLVKGVMLTHLNLLYASTICIQVNEVLAVPPIVVIIAKSSLTDKYDLSSVELMRCAAAPLAGSTITQAMKNLPNCKKILQGYGMTETTLVVVKEPDDRPGKPGSCGQPLPGVEAKVVDINTRQYLGPHEQGEICLKTPSLMKGYKNNEKATKDVFDEEGFIKTGDIGYYDNEGYFYVVDRLKEIIKYKGQQVAPAAVESVILQHSAVAECGVVGKPDELAGELPTAFVVLKQGFDITEQDILDFTASKLSPISRLRGGVIFVKEIPRNGSGKILRRVLRDILKELTKKL